LGGEMKRIVILFDDDALYRAVKAEAAREGRSVKDVVAEALNTWLHGRTAMNAEQRKAALQVLQELDRLRETLPRTDEVQATIDEIRAQRP
jgi:plasmid stability protein